MTKVFKQKINKKAISVFTPEHTISAFIDLPSGTSPIEVIWHTATIALDTEKICFVYSLADNGVYFIAAPAQDFLGHTNSATPLAAALPGNVDHKGDGAYISDIGGNLFSVVIKGKQTLSCYIGDKTNVLKFAENVPQFWVDKPSLPWYSLTQYQQQETIKLMSYISLGSFAGMLFFAALSYFFQYEAARNVAVAKQKQNKIAEQEQDTLLHMHASLQNNTTSPVLKNYLGLSTFVIKQNGTIVNYEYKNKHVKYAVELPPTAVNLSYFGKDINPVIKEDGIYIEKEENL